MKTASPRPRVHSPASVDKLKRPRVTIAIRGPSPGTRRLPEVRGAGRHGELKFLSGSEETIRMRAGMLRSETDRRERRKLGNLHELRTVDMLVGEPRANNVIRGRHHLDSQTALVGVDLARRKNAAASPARSETGFIRNAKMIPESPPCAASNSHTN